MFLGPAKYVQNIVICVLLTELKCKIKGIFFLYLDSRPNHLSKIHRAVPGNDWCDEGTLHEYPVHQCRSHRHTRGCSSHHRVEGGSSQRELTLQELREKTQSVFLRVTFLCTCLDEIPFLDILLCWWAIMVSFKTFFPFDVFLRNIRWREPVGAGKGIVNCLETRPMLMSYSLGHLFFGWS